jgi:hypothetical protein
MAFAVTLLVVRSLGLCFAIFWAFDTFAWWKLVVVGFGVVLVGMQVRKVRQQAERDRALTVARRAGRGGETHA